MNHTPTNKEYSIKSIRELILNFPDELLDELCSGLPQYIREIRQLAPDLSSSTPGIIISHNLFDEIIFCDDGKSGSTTEVSIKITNE